MRRLLTLTAAAAIALMAGVGATASASAAPAAPAPKPTSGGLLGLGAFPTNDLYTLSDTGKLAHRSGLLPNLVLRQVQTHNLRAGDTLIGLDVRPATGGIYSLGRSGQLYIIDPGTGRASALGTPNALGGAQAVGFDFNPTVDRIRVTTSRGGNFRLDPNTGALSATDTALAYAPTDRGAGATPIVAASAYSNSVAGAVTTTLYGIDANRNTLVRQGSAAGATPVVSPNTGQLFTVGSLGRDIVATNGFDIDRTTPFNAVAAVRGPAGGGSHLVNIDLRTGKATPMLFLPLGDVIVGLTFAFIPPHEVR